MLQVIMSSLVQSFYAWRIYRCLCLTSSTSRLVSFSPAVNHNIYLLLILVRWVAHKSPELLLMENDQAVLIVVKLGMHHTL